MYLDWLEPLWGPHGGSTEPSVQIKNQQQTGHWNSLIEISIYCHTNLYKTEGSCRIRVPGLSVKQHRPPADWPQARLEEFKAFLHCDGSKRGSENTSLSKGHESDSNSRLLIVSSCKQWSQRFDTNRMFGKCFKKSQKTKRGDKQENGFTYVCCHKAKANRNKLSNNVITSSCNYSVYSWTQTLIDV